MFEIISSEVCLASAIWLGSKALKCWLVEARHHHVGRVLYAQHTHATHFILKLWYDSIVKCIIDNFSRKILAQAVKNMHDHIFILWQIKG